MVPNLDLTYRIVGTLALQTYYSVGLAAVFVGTSSCALGEIFRHFNSIG